MVATVSHTMGDVSWDWQEEFSAEEEALIRTAVKNGADSFAETDEDSRDLKTAAGIRAEAADAEIYESLLGRQYEIRIPDMFRK